MCKVLIGVGSFIFTVVKRELVGLWNWLRHRRHPFQECITHEDRYVPFLDSEKRIDEALDRVDGPPVVLLHGGAGKGKSTVARRTYLHYSHQKRFAHVFYLNCGSKVPIKDILSELIRRFTSEPIDNEQKESTIREFLKKRKIFLILDDVSDGKVLRKILTCAVVE